MPLAVPDAVGQEVHNLIALQCRDALMVQRAQSAKEIQQEEFMLKTCHGSEAHTSSLRIFLKDDAPFALFGYQIKPSP